MKTEPSCVLVVDDDLKIHSVVSHYLEDDGYKVLFASSGREALSTLETQMPDVVLLDLGLPDIDGLTLLNQIRRQYETLPIIVVSGKDDATDKVVGLEMGADDYIGKPFHLRELTARIKTVLRRTVREQNPAHTEKAGDNADDNKEIIKFENWIMNAGRFEVCDSAGKIVDLTTGEFQLLRAMLHSANRVMSREQLFDLTRKDDYDSFDRAVDIQIGRLRKKLNDDPKAPRLIKTVRGVGYMFIGDVKRVS